MARQDTLPIPCPWRQFPQAFEHEKRAVAVDPDCVDCRTAVAEMLLEEDHYREAFDVASIALGIAAEGARPNALVIIADTWRDLLASSGTTAADLACRRAPPFGSPPPGTDTVPLTIRIAASGLRRRR
jgi:hypothetical protein